MGQMVLSETNQAGIKTINLDHQPTGIYNVQYQINGKLFVEKVGLE